MRVMDEHLPPPTGASRSARWCLVVSLQGEAAAPSCSLWAPTPSSCSLVPHNIFLGWGQGVSRSEELGEGIGQTHADPSARKLVNTSCLCAHQRDCLQDNRGYPHALSHRRNPASGEVWYPQWLATNLRK